MFSTIEQRFIRHWVRTPEGSFSLGLQRDLKQDYERAIAMPSVDRVQGIGDRLNQDLQRQGREYSSIAIAIVETIYNRDDASVQMKILELDGGTTFVVVNRDGSHQKLKSL